jgi:hypothetical protein
LNALTHTTRSTEQASSGLKGNVHHAFLYFRCAVRRAPELFRLARPLSPVLIARLTRRFREMLPSVDAAHASERVYSLYDRLLTPTQAFDPQFLKRHETWFEKARNLEGKTLNLLPEEGLPGPEEQCEFLYLPGLQRCYTLVWRWLPVLSLGSPSGTLPIALEDCNWIQDRMRESLGLEPGTLFELYPSWVKPWRAESIWARHKSALKADRPWNYRFKPWEESPE